MKIKIKPVLAGVGILLVIFALIGWYLYNKPHTGISNIDAEMKTAAADLFNEFQRDEAAANKKYLNKVIEVTGNIADIQNVNGSQIIFLSSNDAMGGVSCRLNNADNKKNAIPGKSATVIIKGRCSGYTMDVNLVDCILK